MTDIRFSRIESRLDALESDKIVNNNRWELTLNQLNRIENYQIKQSGFISGVMITLTAFVGIITWVLNQFTDIFHHH
jgi:hypothetical protein